jgi:23S rRNA-/tRNA-specific pseudouridylate synthase
MGGLQLQYDDDGDDGDDDDDDEEEEEQGAAADQSSAHHVQQQQQQPPPQTLWPAPPPGVVRPGIVHRLDRGTSGLMVVAKSDAAHAGLCAQFKARSVSRIYTAITTGAPSPGDGRVATNIARDPAHRLRMAAAPFGSGRGRRAASNYTTLGLLAGGGAALVEWRLETGRTHQIRCVVYVCICICICICIQHIQRSTLAGVHQLRSHEFLLLPIPVDPSLLPVL